MKKLTLLLTLAFGWLAAQSINAQATGAVISFQGDTVAANWNYDTQYSLAQRDGMLLASSLRNRPWTSFSYAFDAPLNLTANPVVSIDLRSQPGMLLSVYLADVAANRLITYPVHATPNMHTYTFDFTAVSGLNMAAITRLIFVFNGATIHYRNTAEIAAIRVGSEATKRANFSAIPDFSTYMGRTGLQIRVNGIENASQLTVTGGDGLLTNLAATAIANGVSMLSFDTVAGATGTSSLTVTATGANGAQDNAYSFAVLVEDNLPPTMQAPSEIVATVGESTTVRISGVSDGNTTVNQPINFEVTAANPALASGFTVERAGDSPHAYLSFTPQAIGSTDLTFTLTDTGGGNDTASFVVPLRIYSQINNPPASNPIDRQVIVANKGQQFVAITGIRDGDDGAQSITITAVSADPAIIANPIAVNYDGGDTATLALVPDPNHLGTTSITVTLTDNGATATNNGNASTSLSFQVETVLEPLTGYAMSEEPPMAIQGFNEAPTPDTWRIEGRNTTTGDYVAIIPDLIEKDGAPAFRFQMVNKNTWAGIWINLPDLDLTANPSISYEILVEPTTQASIQTHVYFWDDNPIRANGERNLPGAHNARATILPGAWRTVAINYNNVVDGLNDNTGTPINTARIQRLLFNFHPTFDFPQTTQTFTVYLRRIRVGDQAQVTAATPDATINPVAHQTYPASAAPVTRTLALHNITNGLGQPASVQASSSNPALTANLALGPVSVDGSATLSFETAATGSAVITLEVSANGSNTKSISFNVTVVDAATPHQTLTINRNQRYQAFHGMGTHQPRSDYFDLYTEQLGASAMRIGMISNQSEPINDNSDPFVINRAGLDYSVFDFDVLRRFKDAGVQTFVLTTWSPPAWMKDNLSLDFQQAQAVLWENTLNRVDPYYYDEYAEYLVAALLMLKEESGIEVAAVGPQNEPAFNEPYPSAILSPVRFAEIIAILGPRLAAAGLNTRIMMPEQVFTQNFYSMAQYMAAVRANPAANQYTDIIATHGYAQDGIGAGQPNFSAWSTMWNDAQSGDFPKELWMSETFPNNLTFDGSINYAMALYGAFRYGNVSMWTSWQIEDQLLRVGQKLMPFYSFQNYAKYLRPGAVRVDLADGGDIYATAWDHPVDETLVTVLVNLGTTARVVQLAAASGTQLPASFSRHLTEENRGFETMGAVGHTVILPARSVTTLVGSTSSNGEPPVINSAAVATAREMQSFSYQIAASNFPTSFAASGLPTGLLINTETGLITGTPAVGTHGTATIELTASNAFGTGNLTLTLTIDQRTNAVPVAAFTVSPASGVVPLAVQFDASGSSDADGEIVSYVWEFGGGAVGSGVQASHTYTAAGEYSVRLTVTDNDGATHTTTRSISASPRPVITFAQESVTYDAPGSRTSVSIGFTMAPAGEWTATASAPSWIILFSTTGNGSGTINYRVQPNAGGHRRGTIRIWDSEFVIQQWGASPWSSLPATNGWRDIGAGQMYDAAYPWVYLNDHGFAFHGQGTASTGYHLYNVQDDLGWLFIVPDVYPYLFSFERGGWLFFDEPGSTAPGERWFFDYSLAGGTWIRLPADN
jgi:O-glycosyl hydrolase/PKD repeat protein